MKNRKFIMLIVLFVVSLVMLTGCGSPNDQRPNDNTKSGDDVGEITESDYPTIESLNAKYNGFEIHYTSTESHVYVGGKGDVYWVFITSYENPDEIQESSVISEKNGSEWINYYYSDSAEKFETYGSAKDKSVAAEYGNIYYLQLMLAALSTTKPTTTTLKGEQALCYSMGMGTRNIYVSAVDGYTMQITYGDDVGQSMVFSEVLKGNDVYAPDYK